MTPAGPRLLVQHLDCFWCAPRAFLAPHSGGYRSVRNLQATLRWRNRSQARRAYLPHPERAVRTEHGVLIEKRDADGAWVPYCRVELTHA